MRTQVRESREILSGTLRTQDLLDAFSAELLRQASRALNPMSGAQSHEREEAINHCVFAGKAMAYREMLVYLGDNESDLCGSDAASECLTALEDALNTYCSEELYFGSHEGDGACFGYWPVPEQALVDKEDDEFIEQVIPGFLRKQVE